MKKRICSNCGGDGETHSGRRSPGGAPLYGPPQISHCYNCGGSAEVEDNRKVTPEQHDDKTYVDAFGYLKKDRRN